MKQNYHLKSWVRKTGIYELLVFSALLSNNLSAQQSFTFTPCGATGGGGPSQTQVNTTYTNSNLNGLVTVSGGIQQFTVPTTGLYKIETRGAEGYPHGTGGRGAIMYGEFTLTAGSVLKIVVGQHGQVNPALGTAQYGGGGGSFVSLLNNTPLIVAGGGGGSHATSYTATTADGTVSTTGNSGTGTSAGSGGTGGSGGAAASSANGGAGMFGDGGGTTGPALSFTNGATGGNAGASAYANGAIGGFGGGGGTQSYNNSRGGGGGGYSGGGGAQLGQPTCWGGGGGSYNNGTNQLNLSGANTFSDGVVIITEACNISLIASGSNSIAPSICSGQSVTLTTNGVSNYAWSNGNTTSSVIVVSPTATTVYSLSAISVSNCTAYKSMTVTVSSGLPVLTITNTPSTLCLGKSATLTAGGGLGYSWTGGATTVTNGVGFFPTATTVYTVTGTNGCGQSIATTTITIAPLVVTASTTSSLVCQGNTVVLTATSSVNGYTWYPNGATSNPLTTAPQANTIYTVTASDGTCIGTATVAVNTNPIPTINVTASNSLVCEGSVVTLTASGASTYTWVNTTSNAAVISVTAMAPTNYQVSGSNSFGCSASGGQIVLTNAAPVLTLTATKMIVCVGGSVNLTASSAAGVTYAWVNGPATPGNLVNPTSPTTYSVVGTGTNGCPSPEYMITINTLSTNLSVSAATTAICEGKSTTLTATGANTYTWTGIPSFQGNALVTPATTTVYTVVANTTITGLSCPSTTNITITVNSNPTITVNATKTVVCRTDANIILTAVGAVTYSWSANTNSASSTASNVSVHPIILNNNIYSVIGMDANGCINSGSVTINVRTCTGIEESKGLGNNVFVYPNPSNGEFNVRSDSEITLKVINELGQEVRTIMLSEENNFKATVSNLASGIYFVVGQNASGKVNQKVVVTK